MHTPVVPPDVSLSSGERFVLSPLLHWIAIDPLDSVIQPSNYWPQERIPVSLHEMTTPLSLGEVLVLLRLTPQD